MSGVDIHPEELIDKLERGGIEPAERARLAAHLVVCEVCRFELALRDDLEREALAAAVPPQVPPESPSAPAEAAVTRISRRSRFARRARRWGAAWGIAAALFVLAAVSFASYAARRGWPLSWRAEPSRSAGTTPRAVDRANRARGAAVWGATANGNAASPPTPIASESAAVGPSASAGTERDARSAGVHEATSAAKLFSAANEARRSGKLATAIELYEKLERRFPASQEASVSHVILGRLLATTDPAGALAQFDGYLLSGAASMAAEACVGRARALETLGRGPEARAAWQEVRLRFPRSVYAEEATNTLATPPPP